MTDPRLATLYREIAGDLGVPVAAEEPLARWTTMGVGGPARWAFFPPDTERLLATWRALREGPLPVRVLAGGSNVIVADEGIDAAVIVLGRAGGTIRREGNELVADATVPFPALVRRAAEEGLAGLAFAEGIPGRLGGAVRMNAGTGAGELADVLAEVEVADAAGRVRRHRPGPGDFGYRESFVAREGLLVLRARLALSPADPAEIRAEMEERRARRRATQPRGRSAGCIFRNLPGQPVGAIVDRLGLKGTRIGDAAISTEHGNFIVNLGHARAADVLALVDLVRERVARETGLEPHLEVEIWRDPR